MEGDRSNLTELKNQYNKLRSEKIVDKQSAEKIKELQVLVDSLRVELQHEKKEKTLVMEDNRTISKEHTDVRIWDGRGGAGGVKRQH